VADDLEDTIAERALTPAQAHGDSGGTTEHPLPDLVVADKHLAARRASANPAASLRMYRLVPPGSV